ncbi:MAG: SPOR domain-containing protein [Treponema sp.]|jgi:DedD protein|nr:SPOR domain-containing protein [Treponema sp.]
MEKKKLLLVAVSVGVFLVIVMGAAILVLSPKSGTAAAAIERPIPPGVSFSGTQSGPADAAGMDRDSGAVQGLETPPSAFTANQENVFYFLGDNPDQIVQQTGDEERDRVVIAVPKPAAAAVPNAPPVQPKPAAAPVRPAPAPAAAPAPRTAVPAAVPARPRTETRDDFWVQTGSFSTLVRADGVRETLSTKGIASIIENREVEGKTFYRVRIGPYTSRNEANYWLSLIKTIQGFEESQIWQSQSRR